MATTRRDRMVAPLHVRRLTPQAPIVGGPFTLCGVPAVNVDVTARPLDPAMVKRNARIFCARCLRSFLKSEVTNAR